MAINYSALLRLPKPDAGTQTWATYWHRLADMVDKFVGAAVTVTKLTGSTTLPDADGTADSAKALVIKHTGTLTGNTTVVVPTRARLYLVVNGTSGAFTLTVKTASGTGIAVKQGHTQFLWCDGTNVVKASRLSGLVTATELIGSPITATNSGSVFGAGAILAAAYATGSIGLTKLAGATGSYGGIITSATTAGFPWKYLARGTARQRLAMTTGVAPKLVWTTDPFSRVATSTAVAMVFSSAISYTHGLTGIAAVTDIKLVRLRLLCLSTDLEYSAGDLVEVDCTFGGNTTNNTGINAVIDGLTAVKAVIGANGFRLIGKSTQTWGNATAAKWAIYFQVYA